MTATAYLVQEPATVSSGFTEITEPGMYRIPAEAYHADPVPGGSLSSSIARRLVPPSCPAKAIAMLETPFSSKAMDFGTCAHQMILGIGPELAVLDYENYKKPAAQQAAKEARERGAMPLLRHEFQIIEAMAAAILRDPLAGDLFSASDRGITESSLFWRDPETGAWCRARPDWMSYPGATRRFVIVDYKTCEHAGKSGIARSVAAYSYHQQDDWYRRGARALGLDPDPAFLFVFQEKTPPYLIQIAQIDAEARRIAAERNRLAIHTWIECQDTGEWPGYGEGIAQIKLPRWAAYEHEELTR